MPRLSPDADLDLGPVRIACRHHPARTPAEPGASAWLAAALGLPVDALGLARDGRGRPQLGMPAFDCNWSHGGCWLLVALGRGVRVGIDVEPLRPRPRALELARRYFHADEAEALAALPADARALAFLRLWCAKEAVLKAHGHGLSFGLHRLRFAAAADGLRLEEMDPVLGAVADWRLRELELPDGAVGAVAWRGAG
jgi:4'-phosphopantetheinyl transferase